MNFFFLLTILVALCLVFYQVNLPINIMPITYTSQNHGQNSYSSDDLPKNPVMALNQGSAVKSMDFHPVQQILLLGKHRQCLQRITLPSLIDVCLNAHIQLGNSPGFQRLYYLVFHCFSWNKHG